MFSISCLSDSVNFPSIGSFNSVGLFASSLLNEYRFTPSCILLKSFINLAFFELSTTPVLFKATITAVASTIITIIVITNTINDIPFFVNSIFIHTLLSKLYMIIYYYI
ncbi:hypothetical protein D3C71_1670860 [compost metagenome]